MPEIEITGPDTRLAAIWAMFDKREADHPSTGRSN